MAAVRTFFFFFIIFPLYSKGVRLSLDVYIAVTVFPPTLSSVRTFYERRAKQFLEENKWHSNSMWMDDA